MTKSRIIKRLQLAISLEDIMSIVQTLVSVLLVAGTAVFIYPSSVFTAILSGSSALMLLISVFQRGKHEAKANCYGSFLAALAYVNVAITCIGTHTPWYVAYLCTILALQHLAVLTIGGIRLWTIKQSTPRKTT